MAALLVSDPELAAAGEPERCEISNCQRNARRTRLPLLVGSERKTSGTTEQGFHAVIKF